MTEADELNSQTGTHANVVIGRVRVKPELNDTQHVFYRKYVDLTDPIVFKNEDCLL